MNPPIQSARRPLSAAAISGRGRKSRRGSVLMLSLVFMVVFMTLGASVMDLSSSASRVANRGAQKVQARELAEAGVEDLYAQICIGETATNPSYPASISSTTLTSTLSGTTTTDGSFVASVKNTPTVVTSNGSSSETFVLCGTGTSADGTTTSTIWTTMVASMNANGSSGFPDTAVLSNGKVLLSGGSSTIDATPGQHQANVESNGDVTTSGGSTVDGTIDVPSSAYTNTVKNSPGNTISQLSSPLSFPSAATISSWKTGWYNEATADTTAYPSGQTLASYSLNGNGTSGTISAPAYITGNLNIQGGAALTVSPQAGFTGPAVLYVHGTITCGSSSITNNGVIIVADGKIDCSGGSNNNYTSTNTANSALISFNTDNNKAINLSGGSGDVISLVYAISGGVTLSGSSTITGGLISGSAAATVTFSGTSSLSYPNGLTDNPVFPGNGFSGGSLASWNQVQ